MSDHKYEFVHCPIILIPLSCFIVQTVESAVGIHIGVSALTWAHIDYSGKLLDWDLYSLEFGNRKLHVTSLFRIVSLICQKWVIFIAVN
jgi:hypothetical protein